MTNRNRALVLASALAVLFTGTGLASEATVSGKLTTTIDDALYGVAVMRAAPEASAEKVATLDPGSRVMVYPETSPEGWWYIILKQDGGDVTGYVPRSFVKVLSGPFGDVDEEHWAAPALARLKDSGFLTGYDNGMFQGEKAFTRFEMAVILDRYMGRLKEARTRIEDMIAKIPMQSNLEGVDAARLDEVVKKLEQFSEEEAELQKFMGETRTQLEAHGERLGRLDQQAMEAVTRDGAQDRRIDELARTSARIASDLESFKKNSPAGMPLAQANPPASGDLATTLAAQVVRIKELMSRAENLESKVGALEARDRLAGMLQKDGNRRSTLANLAARIDKLEVRGVGM